MSRFRLTLKIGHVERIKRLRGYLIDYSHLPKQEYEWTRTVYGNIKDEIPRDMPKPLGKRVITTTFLDANILHDIVTGKSVTAVLHFVKHHPNRLVLKETSHCGDCNIWFRVCSCQNCNRTNYGP